MFKDIREEAMEMWRSYGEKYRTLLPRYRELVEKGKELNIKMRKQLKERDIKEIPDIPFLKIDNAKGAQIYIDGLFDSEVRAVMHRIELLINDDVYYRMLSDRVCEYEGLIRAHGKPTNRFAVDPDHVFGKRTKRRGRVGPGE